MAVWEKKRNVDYQDYKAKVFFLLLHTYTEKTFTIIQKINMVDLINMVDQMYFDFKLEACHLISDNFLKHYRISILPSNLAIEY